MSLLQDRHRSLLFTVLGKLLIWVETPPAPQSFRGLDSHLLKISAHHLINGKGLESRLRAKRKLWNFSEVSEVNFCISVSQTDARRAVVTPLCLHFPCCCTVHPNPNQPPTTPQVPSHCRGANRSRSWISYLGGPIFLGQENSIALGQRFVSIYILS